MGGAADALWTSIWSRPVNLQGLAVHHLTVNAAIDLELGLACKYVGWQQSA